MLVKEYEKIHRLRSEQLIGQQNIAVEWHHAVSFPQHWHNYFEIELILSGSARYSYNAVEHIAEKGDLFFLTPVDFHGVESEGGIELINISFEDASVPLKLLPWLSSPRRTRTTRLTDEEFDRFCKAAQLLRHECASGGQCAGQLLEYLLSTIARKNPVMLEDGIGSTQIHGIKKAISYIELHFREPITQEQLADLSGYHPTYFSELFRKVTGQTYKDRIRQLRISYAKMLLANGCSVSETCFASGFGSLSNFSASFREKCGIAPKDYRKVQKKE